MEIFHYFCSKNITFNYFSHIMSIRKLITYILLLFTISIDAQFRQEGITLEYNRSKSKTIFTEPVFLNFSGAGSTDNDENGNFILTFNKSKVGDLVSNFQIQIGNQDYVLFNKDRLSEWVLTPNKKMEVLVCNHTIIQALEEKYTSNFVALIKKKYDEQREQVKLLKEDNQTLEKKLNEIETQYKAEIEEIKKQAVMFAYVDETELDSLELKMRERILDNDIEEAVRIGNQMNLTKLAESRIRNINKAMGKVEETVQDALRLSRTLEQHIANCRQTRAFEEEILPYQKSLIDIYRKLVDVYQNKLRCSSEFLEDLERKAGQALYNYYWALPFMEREDSTLLKESAKMGYPYALAYLATESEDYESAKKYALLLHEKMKNNTIYYPYYSSDLKSRSEEILESFPDFIKDVNGDSLFFHITNEHEVSLVHYHHINKKLTKIKIPQSVTHNGMKYKVTGIGEKVFSISNYYGPLHLKNNPFDSSCSATNTEDTIVIAYRTDLNGITDIQLPDGIKSIGGWAFIGKSKDHEENASYYKDLPNYRVNIPKKIKRIGKYAYAECLFESNVMRIPEGAEDVGIQSETYCTYIPSTVKHLDEIGRNVKISPKNPYFHQIYGNVYDADTSKILTSYLYLSDTLFISKKMIAIPNDNYFPLKKIIQEEGNESFSIYDECLYSYNYDRLILIPRKENRIVKIHPYTSSFSDIAIQQLRYGHIDKCIFPDSINPALPALLAYFVANQYHQSPNFTISYNGVEHTISTNFPLDEANIFLDKIKEKHPDDSWLALSVAIHLIDCDLLGAININENLLKNSPYYDNINNEIDKGWETFKKNFKYGILGAKRLSNSSTSMLNTSLKYLDYLITNIEPKADFYYARYLVLKYLRREKDAEEDLEKVKEYDPDYNKEGHLTVYKNIFDPNNEL